MSIVYIKTLKGVEETALRSEGLQLKLRTYLKLVDGVKSADEIKRGNPSLLEVDAALLALQNEGYIETLR